MTHQDRSMTDQHDDNRALVAFAAACVAMMAYWVFVWVPQQDAHRDAILDCAVEKVEQARVPREQMNGALEAAYIECERQR